MPFVPADSLLFEESETAKNVSRIVTYTPAPDQRVESYSYTISPEPPSQLIVTATSSEVSVFAEHLLGFFRPVVMRAKDFETGEVFAVLEWDELPPNKTLVQFVPPSGSVVYELTVSVTYIPFDELTQEEFDPVTESQTYQMVIKPDYSAGKEALRNYVTSSSATR